MAAMVRATAITGSDQAAAPMAMRPDTANGAVAGKRETSFDPALSAWSSYSYGAPQSSSGPLGPVSVSGRAAGLSGYSKARSTAAACWALPARKRVA